MKQTVVGRDEAGEPYTFENRLGEAPPAEEFGAEGQRIGPAQSKFSKEERVDEIHPLFRPYVTIRRN